MEQILKDVNAVVGVTGSFVCDGQGTILARQLPEFIDETNLTEISRTLCQSLMGLDLSRRGKVGDLDLQFDQGQLVLKRAGAASLGILCQRRINVPLLNLTADLAVKRIKAELAKPPTKPATKAPVLDGGRLQDLEQLTAQYVGCTISSSTELVTAKMQALGEARQAFPMARLSELVEAIASEIVEAATRPDFREEIKTILRLG